MYYVTFRTHGQLYCLKIEDVSEVIPDEPLLRLPRIPESFDGLLQLRGRPVTVFNFARSLDLPSCETLFHIIILAPPREHFALRVPGVVETMILSFDESKETSSFSLGEERTEEEQHYHLLEIERVMALAKSLVLQSVAEFASGR